MRSTAELKFTLRLPREMCDKLDYIASYWGRTRAGEIHWTLRQHIKAFEDEMGKIILDENREN